MCKDHTNWFIDTPVKDRKKAKRQEVAYIILPWRASVVSLSHDGNGGLWEDDVSCLISLVTGTWHHIESVLKGQMWNDQVFGRREDR